MAISTAASLSLKSRVTAYKITKGSFQDTSPNLPQRILILGEANTANQGSLDTTVRNVTTLQEAGQQYGYGSPIYAAMRILFPKSGSGLAGIPVDIIAQEEPAGATAKSIEITPVGTATGNGTHFLKIAGRTSLDAQPYAINVNKGDTASEITQKIEDAVNNVLGSPFSAASTDYEATLTSKWKGLTADELSVIVDRGDDALGITYTYNEISAGSGTPSISDALDLIGNTWYTIIINGYSTETTTMDALEAFNGIPDPNNPTGRYSGIVFKPFIALTGSTADDPSTITDSRKDNVTISICPAPLSKGLTIEAAANVCMLFAISSQNSPNADIGGQSYPDMPTPTTIGSMANYNNRDTFVKKGCSTVDLVSGRYQMQDFVTTYHPVGEDPAQFAYCRNLMLDYNVKYGYFLLEIINVVDKTLAADSDFVDVNGYIKPKQWRAIIRAYIDDLARRALVADAEFSKSSIQVSIGETNPDRLETSFRYKRTGTARISTTDAQAGFNFG